MFFTRRLGYCCVIATVVLVAGFLWPFFFYVGYVLAGILAVALMLNILFLYGYKGTVVATRQCAQRLSIGDDNKVTVHLQNTFNRNFTVLVYDEAPFSFQFRNSKLLTKVKAKSTAQVSYFVRPVRRGSYVFHNINTYISTFPHLVLRRFKEVGTNRVKVYPSFLFLKNEQLLSIPNRDRLWGTNTIRRKGQSKEFEQIREYVVGDDIRSVNWKATARRHNLMVNENREEQSQNIYALIDKGRGMQHTFNSLSLLDHSLNSALQLSYLALQHADNAGLLTFEKEVGSFVAASRSMAQINKFMSIMYDEVSSFRQSDYFNLYEFCKQKIQKRSLLVIYTTFDSLNSVRRQLPYLKRMAISHVVLVTFFIDKDLEKIALQQPTDTLGYVTQMVAEKFSFEQKLVVEELRRYGIYSLLTSPEKLSANVINQYLQFKAHHVI